MGTGERVEPPPLAQQLGALDYHLLAGRVRHFLRRDGVRDRLVPAVADLPDRHAHADAIDGGIGGERADGHGHVVAPALGIGDVGEEEGLALVLLQPAAELPADQRMHLGILVDRLVDAEQEPRPVERVEMVAEIRIRALLLSVPGGKRPSTT